MAVVLNLSQVNFVRNDRLILAPISWQVSDGERWLVLGANGSGKTTLLRIASMYEHPSSGTVEVLGERLGPNRRPPAAQPYRLCIGGADVATAPRVALPRRRDDRQTRRPRAVVAPLHR